VAAGGGAIVDLLASSRSRAGLASAAAAREYVLRGHEPAGSDPLARTRSECRARVDFGPAVCRRTVRPGLCLRYRRTRGRRRGRARRIVASRRTWCGLPASRAVVRIALDAVRRSCRPSSPLRAGAVGPAAGGSRFRHRTQRCLRHAAEIVVAARRRHVVSRTPPPACALVVQPCVHAYVDALPETADAGAGAGRDRRRG